MELEAGPSSLGLDFSFIFRKDGSAIGTPEGLFAL